MSALLLSVRPYWAVLGARFRMLLQYRAAALAGFMTQVFFGLIRVMFFEAFFNYSVHAQPMSYQDTVTYIWLGQATLLLTMLTMEGEVAAMIRTGAVAYEMARPLDLYAFWYSRVLASRAAPLMLRALPLALIAWLFFGFQMPASFVCGALWLVSTFAALFLAASISTLMTISLFWTLSGEGLVWIVSIATLFFSGLVVPLPLLPDWAQPILRWMPFGGLADVPFRLYLGHIPPGDALLVIGRQILWIVILVGLGRAALARGLRRLVAQGG